MTYPTERFGKVLAPRSMVTRTAPSLHVRRHVPVIVTDGFGTPNRSDWVYGVIRYTNGYRTSHGVGHLHVSRCADFRAVWTILVSGRILLGGLILYIVGGCYPQLRIKGAKVANSILYANCPFQGKNGMYRYYRKGESGRRNREWPTSTEHCSAAVGPNLLNLI